MTRALHVAEPPAIYLMRPPLVVDCSVLCALLFQEESRDQAYQLLAAKMWHAPFLLDFEIASVAQKKAKLGCDLGLVAQALVDYAELPIELHRSAVSAQFELAQRYRLSTYDAAYLWLAAEIKAPLATFDDKLAKAATAHLASLE